MGLFDFGMSSSSSKSSQPFDQQYSLWTLLAMISPEFARAFQAAKPQMYGQVFGKGTDPASIASGTPGRNPMGILDPRAEVAGGAFGGQTTPDEQSLLDNSYFGLAPKLDLSEAKGAAQTTKGISDDLNNGGFLKTAQQFQNDLGGAAFKDVKPPTAPQVSSDPFGLQAGSSAQGKIDPKTGLPKLPPIKGLGGLSGLAGLGY